MPWARLHTLFLKVGLKAGFTSGLALALIGLAGFTEIPSVRYVPPPDRGTPTSDRGTGSRGDCLYQADLPPLAALVGQSHLSLTVSDHPTLWAYIPYTTADASQGEVIIQVEASDLEIYRGSFPLSSTPGIVGIRLPDTMPALAVGEEYRWYIDIPCSPVARMGLAALVEPATLTGLVKRVEVLPALMQALETAPTAAERMEIYGNHHIWYDLLSELAELRLMANPNPQIEQLWVNLLSDPMGANLEGFSQLPLIEATTASSPPE